MSSDREFRGSIGALPYCHRLNPFPSEASLLHGEPCRTMLSPLVHRRNNFPTPAGTHWASWNGCVAYIVNLMTICWRSVLLPSVLWRCWLGGRKGIRPVKKLSGGVLAWLSVWSEVQTCIWPRWCHCHSLSLASVQSRLVLPFWYRLTRTVTFPCDIVMLHGHVTVEYCNVHLHHCSVAPSRNRATLQCCMVTWPCNIAMFTMHHCKLT